MVGAGTTPSVPLPPPVHIPPIPRSRYADYAKGFSQRLDMLNAEIAANERFATYLYFCQLKPESGGLDLPSFLIKPIQRLCRYPLLLSEVVKHMPDDHPSRAAMISTRDNVERVAHEVNSRMAAADQRDALVAVWRMLDEAVPDFFMVRWQIRVLSPVRFATSPVCSARSPTGSSFSTCTLQTSCS